MLQLFTTFSVHYSSITEYTFGGKKTKQQQQQQKYLVDPPQRRAPMGTVNMKHATLAPFSYFLW